MQEFLKFLSVVLCFLSGGHSVKEGTWELDDVAKVRKCQKGSGLSGGSHT